MRKIKFRAWSGSREKMIYCDLHDRNWYFHPRECQLYREKNQRDHVLPIMQFTGLIDKNDVEIYEGDIIKFSYSDEVFFRSVLYCDLNAGFVFTRNHCNGVIFHKNHCDHFEFEVVGNIYEKPDLLL